MNHAAQTSWYAAALILMASAAPGLAGPVLLYPTDDATIDMRQPTSNAGDSVQLAVRNRYGITSHAPDWARETLLQFDLSALDTEITSATLNLYYHSWDDNDPAGRELHCHDIVAPWSQSTVTWDNQPGYAATATAVAVVPGSPGAWMSWDVTSSVQALIEDGTGGQFGWQIVDPDPWDAVNIPVVEFYSSEHAGLVPYLSVVPEPGTISLLMLGGIAMLRRRHR